MAPLGAGGADEAVSAAGVDAERCFPLLALPPCVLARVCLAAAGGSLAEHARWMRACRALRAAGEVRVLGRACLAPDPIWTAADGHSHAPFAALATLVDHTLLKSPDYFYYHQAALANRERLRIDGAIDSGGVVGSGDEAQRRAAALLNFAARHCPRLRCVAVVLPAATASESGGGGAAGDYAPSDEASDALAAAVGRLAAAAAAAAGGNAPSPLRRVALVNAGATDAALAALASGCRALRHLAVGCSGGGGGGGCAEGGASAAVTDAGLAAVARGCPQLASLALLRCARATDAALDAFAGSRALRSLTLHACTGITSAGLARFVTARGARLRELDVAAASVAVAAPTGSPTPLDHAACAALAAHCPALRALRVCEADLHAPVLDDAALAAVARGAPALAALDLAGVEAGDGLLAALADGCPQLARLRLDSTRATDAGIAAVAARCPLLRDLTLTGEGRHHAWLLPAELAQGGSGVTEAVLPALGAGGCRALAALDLTGLLPAIDPAAAGADEAARARAWDADSDDPSGAADTAFAAAGDAGAPAGGDGDDGDDAAGGDDDDHINNAILRPPSSSTTRISAHRSRRWRLEPPLLAPALCAGLASLTLDWLKLDHARAQPRLAAALARCIALEELSVAGWQGCDAAELAAALAFAQRGRPRLRRAGLQHSRAGDAALAVLSGAFGATLSTLQLAYCRGATDAGLAAVGHSMRALRVLDLYQAPCVTPAGVAALAASHPALRALHVGHHTAAFGSGGGSGGGGGGFARGWGGARGAGATAHLAPVLEAAAARAKSGSGGGLGLGPVRVVVGAAAPQSAAHLLGARAAFEAATLGRIAAVAGGGGGGGGCGDGAGDEADGSLHC